LALISVRNPYTGETDYQFEDATPESIANAADRLRSNQPAWSAQSLDDRLQALQVFAGAIAARRDEITAALVQDTGRQAVAALEVEAVISFAARAAAVAPDALAKPPARQAQIPSIEGTANRIPCGLVGNISPWNFPLILSFLDTFPALAAGNAVLIKPSEITPRWIEPMKLAIDECPQISRVLDIAAGSGQAGAALVDNADAIVFTGSVATGRKVAERAAQRLIPAFLELGGKDAAVVLASADIDRAVHAITFCSVQSAGQACQSIERVYVAQEIYDDFVRKAVALAQTIGINYPDINAGQVGPFIFHDQAGKVLQQIAAAKGAGAAVLTGGELLNHGGYWIKPTVLTEVDHSMTVMTEETFGPVMPIMPFESKAEAIQLVNDSRYGLSAAVFAGTDDEARSLAEHLRAGAISINDAALTVLIHEFEHDAFGESGLGASRAGKSAYTRFTREQALMTNTGSEALVPTTLG